MRLKAPELEIPPADPFKNDVLGRMESAEALTELICTSKEPLVLSINASWGEGKTTFLKMWRQMLKNRNVNSLYFNAWENDFSEDAFVSLMGEFELGLEELSFQSPDESRKQFNQAKKFAASLIKRSVPTAVKLATAGWIDLNDLSTEAMAEYSEKLAEEQVKRYEDAKKSVEGFKQSLSNFAKAPSTNEVSQPLVILIDELDRCRPVFAVKILEAVKHFFSVPNVVFVLAMDRKQLGYSICSMYGAGMDVSGYLRRFIDIDYNLPAPKKGAFSKAQYSKFALPDLLKQRTTQEAQYELENIETVFSELFEILGCSLREQERCFALLGMAIRTTPKNQPIYPVLLGALIILKIKKHELYEAFVQHKVGYEKVLELISEAPAGQVFLNMHHGCVLEAYLACASTSHRESQELAEKYAEQYKSMVEGLPKARSEKISRIVNHLLSDDAYGMLTQIVRKIDLVSNFR